MMAQAEGNLTDTLALALSQGQGMIKQMEDQQKNIEKLFGELASKQAEIDALKKELRMVQTKERKWRLQNPLSPSPMVLSDETGPSPQPLTPLSSDGHNLSPIPHVQVESSPPKKRPRTTRERTPLKEVGNTTTVPLSRIEKPIAAIPLLAEDGEEIVPKRTLSKSPKLDAEAKKGAYERLGGLLWGPSSSNDVLHARTRSTRPKSRSAASISRNSTSHLNQAEVATRRRSRFLRPKAQSPVLQPLRARPVADLSITDFKLNPEYVEKDDKPGKRQLSDLAAILGDEISDTELLKEVLGLDADEKISKLTAIARDNLICEARARKIAAGFAQSKQQESTEENRLPPDYWNTDFPSSMQEKNSRVNVAERVREEVGRRYQEAIAGQGRWRFKDE